jgi:uncharacterized membrane protein (UPF0127 family)
MEILALDELTHLIVVRKGVIVLCFIAAAPKGADIRVDRLNPIIRVPGLLIINLYGGWNGQKATEVKGADKGPAHDSSSQIEMPARDGDVYNLLLSSTGKLFQVECVVSPPALKQGLSRRPSLAKGTGMLFIFDTLDRHTMWMPDMNFPLDVVWLDETLSVCNISYGLQPCVKGAECPPTSSVYMCKYAIEMNEGEAAIYGFMNGTQLRVSAV